MRSREQSASSVEGMQTRGRKRAAEQTAESEPKRPARRPVRCRCCWSLPVSLCVAKLVAVVSRLAAEQHSLCWWLCGVQRARLDTLFAQRTKPGRLLNELVWYAGTRWKAKA